MIENDELIFLKMTWKEGRYVTCKSRMGDLPKCIMKILKMDGRNYINENMK